MSDCSHTSEQSCLQGDECAQCLREGSSELPSSTGSGTAKLKAALLKWRAAEKSYAQAVLAACHPRTLREFAEDTENALHKVRIILDSDPWADSPQNKNAPTLLRIGARCTG